MIKIIIKYSENVIDFTIFVVISFTTLKSPQFFKLNNINYYRDFSESVYSGKCVIVYSILAWKRFKNESIISDIFKH